VTVIVLLLACAKAPPPESSAATVDRKTYPDLRDEMETHFYRALELQLAVLGGDVPAANTAGGKLAAEIDSGTFPPTWVPFLDETKRAAQGAANATTVREASAALGALSESCASCHLATRGGPREAVDMSVPPEHMARHLYAAYWMGYGLIAPDDHAWSAGARTLASTSIGVDAPAHHGLDARLHDLAARAIPLTDIHARAELWSELLVACSECHATIERPR
jgi:hypothetical protein